MNFWTDVRNVILGFALMVCLLLQYFTYTTVHRMAWTQKAGLDTMSYAIDEGLQENKAIVDIIVKLVTILPDAMDNQITFRQAQAKAAEVTARQSLKESTVMIENLTVGAQGSGVLIQVDGQLRVLTAGHMIDKFDDEFVIMEKGNQKDHLKVVNVNKKTDLLLLRFEDPSHVVSTVRPLEVAEKAPTASDPVAIVGSPLGIEDLYSEGRVVGYSTNFMVFFDHVYFGSSGGGVYNSDGQLVGIISHMIPISINDVTFVLHACTNLTRIHEFLADSVIPKSVGGLKRLLTQELADK